MITRHPRHALLAAFVAGILLSGAGSRPVAAGAAGALVACLRGGRKLIAVAAGAVVLSGAAAGWARLEAIDHSALHSSIGHAVTARGYLIKRERQTQSTHRARMRVSALADFRARGRWRTTSDTVQVRAPGSVPFPPAGIGDELIVTGVLEQPRNRTQSSFDYAAYLRRAGVHGVLQAESVTVTGRRRGGIRGLVDGLRRRAEEGAGRGLDPPMAALARGMVLGQDEEVPAGMANDFKASGLAHLLAVSGQNVTLLSLLALPVLAALGLGRRARLIAALALITVYVPLTGAGPSIMRAGAMGAAGMAAALAGRPASRWYAALLAAAFTLALDPRAWMDPGWQLSFAAVVGIFSLVTPLTRKLGGLPDVLASAVAVTVAATVATAPLMAFHFQQVSVVSLLANFLALPVVAPIMWTGMAEAAMSQVWVEPAGLLNALNGYCLAYLAALAHWSGGLPRSVWSVRVSSPLTLVVAYAVLGALLLGLVKAPRLMQAESRGRWAPAVAAMALALALAAWAPWSRDVISPARFTVSFLDIGQGDAILLQTPAGASALVDGGPAGSGIESKLEAAGVRSLDLVVLTHAQADHQGGVESVLRRFRVAALLDGGAGTRDATHKRILALARRHDTRVLEPRAGDVFRLGALRLRVLSPDGKDGSAGQDRADEDPNDRAVVLLASYQDLDVFLPADAESDVTLSLPLRPVELLKVAHHGSEDEGLPELLDRLRPKVAVIEVGAGNPFGHPREQTLDQLKTAVPSVYRTDRDGDVRFSLEPRGEIVSAAD